MSERPDEDDVDDVDSDRPTLVPKYDVEAVARDAGARSSRAPIAAARPEMPTLTDPVELEAARYASSFTSPPPALELGEAEVAEDAIVGDFEARLGSLDRVPVRAMSSDAVNSLALDPRAGFLLALIDGTLDVRTILDVSGMPAPDTLAILEDLVAQRIVTFR